MLKEYVLMGINKKNIEIVGRVVRKIEADKIDSDAWLSKTSEERLEETERLRRLIWTFRLGIYPDKMEKTGKCILKSEHFNGNDF